VDRSWNGGTSARGGLPALPPALDPRGKRRHSRPSRGAAGAVHSGRVIVKIISAALSLFILIYIG
jgi:hypothetical protein